VAPNHLLKGPAPNLLRASTKSGSPTSLYLPTREGWLYLAAEMDLCSRRILGWSTREDLATELPNAALGTRPANSWLKAKGLLHHSDRGCQYTSTEFRQRSSCAASPPA
jgi:putative transposase